MDTINCKLYLTKNNFLKANYIIMWKTFNFTGIFCFSAVFVISLLMYFLYQNLLGFYIFAALAALILLFLILSLIFLKHLYKHKYITKTDKAELAFQGSKLNIKTYKNGELIDERVYDIIHFYNAFIFGKNIIIAISYTEFYLIEYNDYLSGSFEELRELLRSKKILK